MPYTALCSQAKLAFVSVLFIDSVSIGDEGIYSFSIVSYNGFAIKAQNSIGFSPCMCVCVCVCVCVYVCVCVCVCVCMVQMNTVLGVHVGMC